MTPASARDLRRARVARLRQAKPDLSHRDMAQRLGISKDTVRRDLEALDADVAQTAPAADEAQEPDAPPVAHPAPQVTDEAAPSAEASAATVAPSAPARPLPVRQADPLAGMDVSQWRALRRDLAILAQSGHSAEALVHQAVVATAHAYKQALAAGELQPGGGFLITGMTLRPRAQLSDQPVA